MMMLRLLASLIVLHLIEAKLFLVKTENKKSERQVDAAIHNSDGIRGQGVEEEGSDYKLDKKATGGDGGGDKTGPGGKGPGRAGTGPGGAGTGPGGAGTGPGGYPIGYPRYYPIPYHPIPYHPPNPFVPIPHKVNSGSGNVNMETSGNCNGANCQITGASITNSHVSG